MRVREAAGGDFPAIKAVVALFPDKLMQDHLPRANSFFVAEVRGEIVGCCALQIYSKRIAEIRSLAVAKEHQSKGIASTLIRACLKRADERGVHEVLSISGAIGLFEKHGFGTFNRERFALIKILR